MQVMSRLPFFQANLRKKVKKMLIATILLQQRKKPKQKSLALFIKLCLCLEKTHNEITQSSQAKHLKISVI